MSSPAEALPSGPEYSGDTLLIFTGVFIPVLVVCVALRVLARHLVKSPFGVDDVLVFASLVFQLGMAGIAISTVKNAGVGYHQAYLLKTSPEKLIIWGKHLLAIEYVYLIGVNVPKLAILALYRRLFPNKRLRIIVYILAVILIGLIISTVIVASVACRPYAANWDHKLPGAVCIDKEAFFIYSSLPNIITDVVMLALPMPVVWKLHTSARMKVGLTATFIVGSFGLVTSILRLTTFFHKNSFTDSTWNAVDLIIWTQIEADVYLISACIMTWRTLLERIGANKLAMKLTTRNRSSKSGGSSGTLDAGRKGGFTGRSDIQLVSTGGMGINKGFTLLPEEEGGSLVALDPGRIRVDSSFRIDEENGRGVRRY